MANLRLVVIAAPFIAIIVTQALLATVSLQMASALRGYVTGESMWSKGQHQAVYFLDKFIDSRDPLDFARYEAALAGPMGDRDGRMALEANPPDEATAREGFLRGGNHPDDVPALIWLFKYFGWFSYMKTAVDHWRVADSMLVNIRTLADGIRSDAARLVEPDVRAAWIAKLTDFNDRITPLTNAFSRSLGEGARFVQAALLIANIVLASIFAALTVWRLNRFVSHRRIIERELIWQASHDGLTQLPNRGALERHAASVLARGGTHALIFIDFDQFKLVNDTKGHAAGDMLLIKVAKELAGVIRRDDILVRLGGDEFAALIANCTPAEAATVAERIRSVAQDLGFSWEGQAFATTASVGLVHFNAAEMTFEQAMQAADMACYMAKERGRNRVQAYTAEDVGMAERVGEMGWVQRLHTALEEDRFRLFAQQIAPVAASADARHVEILLRLEDDSGALIPPNQFIPAAERFGLMPQLDRWVVRRTFRALSDFVATTGQMSGWTCGINLSGASIGDDTFLPFLREQFIRFGISPASICFEITETSAIANLEAASRFVATLREMGCSFALDDFGSGMSSFSYLKRLPVDYLKIDGSFVRDMLTDNSDRAMVEMVNHVAHVTGKKTIAEFVESSETLAALAEIGVDYAQGYAIGRPEPFVPERFWPAAVLPKLAAAS